MWIAGVGNVDGRAEWRVSGGPPGVFFFLVRGAKDAAVPVGASRSTSSQSSSTPAETGTGYG